MSAIPQTREVRLADGRVELIDHSRIDRSALFNHDRAPVPLARRDWTTYNYMALWVGMAHNISTYMLAPGPVAMFTVVVATLAVNIAANVVSPANDFANAFPWLIGFRTGAVITGLIGIAMQPWRLLADPGGYIYTWLLGYSGGLGSIAGVLVADYWLVRRRALSLEDLSLPGGRYHYRGGWNWRAVAATAVGCALAWGGLVVPLLAPLYSYGWFVGFLGSALVHWSLMRLPRGRARDFDHEVEAGRAPASVAARVPLRPPRSN